MTPWIRTLSALLAALGLSLSLLASAASPSSADPKDPTDTPREVAEQALELVQELTAPPTKGQPDPAKPKGRAEGPDLTTALRDLSASVSDLSKADQKTARRFLVRPTEPGTFDCTAPLGCYTAAERADLKSHCAGMFCVHYTQRAGTNRVPGEDNGIAGSWRVGTPSGNGIPDYVETAMATLDKVSKVYVKAGYRKPKGDGVKGNPPNDATVDRFDVYLADLDTAYGQLYGYCSTDDDVLSHTAYSSFCVLDNDFSPAQYGTSQPPLANMWVTTAHEYFHAVQYAYDAAEDGWLLEATATWAEDELFPTVNDNVQYLPYGVLGNPTYSLDQFNDVEAYGNWIFFRYLSERWPGEEGSGMPVIVREIIERTTYPNSSSNTPGAMYSLESIKVALAVRGANLPNEMSWFSRVNRVAPVYYDDASRFPVAPLRASAILSNASRTKSFGQRLNHLSSTTYRFQRNSNLTGRWRVTLSVNLPPRALGGVARITIKRKGQATISGNLTLNANGDGNVTHWFNNDTEWVEVALVNGGSRFASCAYGEDPAGDGTCGGYALDDGLWHTATLRAHR